MKGLKVIKEEKVPQVSEVYLDLKVLPDSRVNVEKKEIVENKVSTECLVLPVLQVWLVLRVRSLKVSFVMNNFYNQVLSFR
jgi:hypothetical protein